MTKSWKINWTRYGYTFLAGKLKETYHCGNTRFHGAIILILILKRHNAIGIVRIRSTGRILWIGTNRMGFANVELFLEVIGTGFRRRILSHGNSKLSYQSILNGGKEHRISTTSTQLIFSGVQTRYPIVRLSRHPHFRMPHSCASSVSSKKAFQFRVWSSDTSLFPHWSPRIGSFVL
jgi:hypothetical protein